MKSKENSITNVNSFNRVHFSSSRDDWETPPQLFKSLDDFYHFTLDPCSSSFNFKCEKHFTLADDGLNQSWQNETVFCNPPYGKDIKLWVIKAFYESFFDSSVVLLLPARTDTSWFHNYLLGWSQIDFIKGRLKFVGSSSSAPFPSMICYLPSGSYIHHDFSYKLLSINDVVKFVNEKLHV